MSTAVRLQGELDNTWATPDLDRKTPGRGSTVMVVVIGDPPAWDGSGDRRWPGVAVNEWGATHGH